MPQLKPEYFPAVASNREYACLVDVSLGKVSEMLLCTFSPRLLPYESSRIHVHICIQDNVIILRLFNREGISIFMFTIPKLEVEENFFYFILIFSKLKIRI